MDYFFQLFNSLLRPVILLVVSLYDIIMNMRTIK